MKKTHLFILNSFTILSLVSCGSGGFTHPKSSEIRHYKADLNHDGKIEKFTKTIEEKTYEIDEENLTWAEAYDTLLSEAASTVLLNTFADNMGIAKNEKERTNLARYEIMHEAEELAMSTGAVIPLYNYQDPYLLKPDVSGIYTSGIGGKFFDQLESTTGKKDFNFSIGTKANSFDPAINDDSSTAAVLTNCFAGLCKWEKGNEIKGQERTYDTHIAINYDILDPTDGFKKDVDEYGIAKYTFKLKDGLYFTSGKSLTAENFIWTWNRAASPYTGTWTSMFENIEGYEEWKSKCAKCIKEGKPQPDFLTEGMTGLTLDKDDPKKLTFSVQLVNDCAYFKDLLAFPAYLPLDKEVITECENNGKIWWLDPKTFSTNGRLKITDIKNMEAGGVKMEKWADYETTTHCDVSTKINSIYLLFLDSDSAMWDKYKSNALDMIDNISTSLIETVKREKANEWRIAPQVGIYYFAHNVNDNTFDIKANQTEGERENLRKAFNLLLNRYDYTQTIVRSGCTDASGFVSAGIIEQCIPGKTVDGTPGTSEPNAGLWCKRYKMDGETKIEFDPTNSQHLTDIKTFTLESADWHERNKDAFKYLDKEGHYKEHWLDKRTKGGFYETVTDSGLTEKEMMSRNITEAIRLAKEAGVNYSGDLDTGKFTNFPDVSVTTNTGTGHEALCERMQAYLATFNINLKIETQEWNAFQTTKKSGAFAIARNGWIADYSDPLTYLAIIISTGGNNDTHLGKDDFHKSK